MDLRLPRSTKGHSSVVATMMGIVGNGREETLTSLAMAWGKRLLLARVAAHGFIHDGIVVVLLPSFLPSLALIFIAWLMLNWVATVVAAMLILMVILLILSWMVRSSAMDSTLVAPLLLHRWKHLVVFGIVGGGGGSRLLGRPWRIHFPWRPRPGRIFWRHG